MLERDFIVIAVHGEGDRDTVNALQKHRNKEEINRLQSNGVQIPEVLSNPPNELPEVLIVLRDQYHNYRIDWPLETWDEVEQWKVLVGWDSAKRQWKTGAVVKVKISG